VIMLENLAIATTTGYALEFEHTRSEGIVASPVAGSVPQNASLVRLHAPMEYLTVYFAGERQGAPPILPSSKSYFQNYNRVLIAGGRYGFVIPTFGGHIWHVAGFFRYVVVGPEGLDSNFALAKMPWEGQAVTDFYVPADNFQAGMINAALGNPRGLSLTPAAQLLAQELKQYG